MTLKDQASLLLAWKKLGAVSADQIVAWADNIVMKAEDELPDWLIELCALGPDDYLKEAIQDAPRPKGLSYEEIFRVKIEFTDPEKPDQVKAFGQWLIQAAVAEAVDMKLPGVTEAHQIDHLIDDCEDEVQAYAEILALVKKHKASCRDVSVFIDKNI